MTGRRTWFPLTVVLALGGCSPEPPAIGAETVEPSEVAPAVVTRADIVSVVTMDATVVATPSFAVLAEEDGIVHHAWFKLDTPVDAGQEVASQSDVALVTPVEGFVVERLVPDGVSVHRGVPVVLLRYAGFGATATVPVSAAYRLYDGPVTARLQVTDGPGPTECTPLPVATSSDPAEAAQPGDDADAGVPQMQVLCAIPHDTELIDGSRGVLGITTGERRDVLTLPLQAVAGAAESGTVVKLVNGEPVLTEVHLGISDGVRVEVVEGLDEGDEVWPYGPNLRPLLPGRQ